ncbi:MAG: hypothetical protein SFY66_04035 [Oculatellaceae cyanobacterium bins.114]|nr:hypothetical protein [Oculatellaceae cyanobacterium bins.114]
MNAATQISDELLGAATQAISILKEEVLKELNRQRNELNKWQLIIQMPTGLTTIRPERHEPPLGSKSFIVREYNGDRMRILGARLKQKNGPINELIARVDYHPLPEFPGYPHTLHYHLGPNANAGRHYVLYPENKIID